MTTAPKIQHSVDYRSKAINHKKRHRKLNNSTVVRTGDRHTQPALFETFQAVRVRTGARKYQSIDFGNQKQESQSKIYNRKIKQH